MLRQRTDIEASYSGIYLFGGICKKPQEVPIRCIINPGKSFKVEFLGEAVVIIHRYGGTYGAARFLLTPEPQSLKKMGKVKIQLANRYGVPLTVIETDEIGIRQTVTQEDLIELVTGIKPKATADRELVESQSLPELIEYEFKTAVFKERVVASDIQWKTLDFETVDLIVEDGE